MNPVFAYLCLLSLSLCLCCEIADLPPLSFQDKEMDQGGLKRNGNRDDSLTFGEAGSRAAVDTGDTAGPLLQSAMHLPGPGPLPLPTMSPNGQSGTKDLRELGGLFEPPQHLALSNVKEGKMIRVHKQPDVDLFNMEDNLLKQSISDLDRASTSVINTSDNSVLVNLPLPDLFPQHIKQEGTFPLDKDLETYSRHTGAGPGNLDGDNIRLIEGTEIWQDLDLPSSLPEISAFELDSELKHLDKILLDSKSVGPASSLVKETKSLMGNGINCTNMKGTNHSVQLQSQQQHQLLQHQQNQLHHQQQPGSLLSSVMIKEDPDMIKKDPDNSFIHICTPGVKQEKPDGDAFCQTQCHQSGLSSLHGGGAMPSPVGIGAGPVYHYRASPSSTVGLQDQKPFGMYSNLPVVGESWASGNRYGDLSGIQRGDDGIPSTALGTFPVTFSR